MLQEKSLYDANYYENCCGEDYSKRELWTQFFGGIADKIVQEFSPKTIVDIGCAWGYLVEALRDRGVEAYGIDISEYAISMAREDIKPYLNVQSALDDLPEKFPRKFDLVVSIEMVEHLYEEDGLEAIKQMCKYSDTILLSSTPSDYEEATHYNVQQPEYWAKHFAKFGFFSNLDKAPSFITPYAFCFYKTDNFSRVVEDYEHNIRVLKCDYENRIQKEFTTNFVSSIFYDTGNGFNANESAEFRFDSEEILIEFSLKPNTKQIRFDPIESAGCIVKDIKILSDKGVIKEHTIYPLNGREIDGLYIFTNTDPQMLIDVKSTDMTSMKIKASVLPLNSFDWLEVFDGYINQFDLMEGKNKEISNCNDIVTEKNKIIADMAYDLSEMANKLADYKNRYDVTMNELANMKINYSNVKIAYDIISQSTFWKITKPFRWILDGVKKILKSNRITCLFYKGLVSLKNNGIKSTYRKVKRKMSSRKVLDECSKTISLSDKERKTQKCTKFNKKIKISIAVPLYNTPEKFLREMIESVMAQTYSDWELCMADGSDNEHENVEAICAEYAKKDLRIQYKKLEKNLGISENTNACIKMATGDYIGLLDHDDLLHPGALYYVMKEICENNADMIYSDEATFEGNIDNLIVVHFKPDFAIDNLRTCHYISHFNVFSKSILMQLDKWFDSNYNGSQDHEITLRLSQKAKKICHIPKILYLWRSHEGSTAGGDGALQKPYTITSGMKAVLEDIHSHGYNGTAESIWVCPSFYRIHYDLISKPLVSIIILNKDSVSLLRTCIDSILTKTTYENYEIIIVENNSTEEEIFEYYRLLESQHNNIKVVRWKEKGFNYATLNNFGVEFAKGEQFILLNNDTEVITDNWIEEMLMFSQREDVGMVGVKLYYPDNTIQHAGVIMGLGQDRLAGHVFLGADKNEVGYMGRLWFPQNLSAVTGACVMIKRKVFDEVGGLSVEFKNSFCDIDLCLKVRDKDYLIVWTPWAELYHYESKSRGYMVSKDKQGAFAKEINQFKAKWKNVLDRGDPYYNPNFSLDSSDYSFKGNIE